MFWGSKTRMCSFFVILGVPINSRYKLGTKLGIKHKLGYINTHTHTRHKTY